MSSAHLYNKSEREGEDGNAGDSIQLANKNHLVFKSRLLHAAGLHRCLSVRFLTAVHQLDVFLQQQPLGEGAFGVWTLPEEEISAESSVL